jgi:hypothetical protein
MKLLFVTIAAAILSVVVMVLWNWLIPSIFPEGPHVTLAQAAGLLVLSRILFGGFRGHGGMHGRWHRHGHHDLTPEDRELLRSGLRDDGRHHGQ